MFYLIAFSCILFFINIILIKKHSTKNMQYDNAMVKFTNKTPFYMYNLFCFSIEKMDLDEYNNSSIFHEHSSYYKQKYNVFNNDIDKITESIKKGNQFIFSNKKFNTYLTDSEISDKVARIMQNSIDSIRGEIKSLFKLVEYFVFECAPNYRAHSNFKKHILTSFLIKGVFFHILDISFNDQKMFIFCYAQPYTDFSQITNHINFSAHIIGFS